MNVAVSQQPIATFSSITATQALGDKVFFAAQDDQYGIELFVSDGTEGNYQLVKDINPGYPGSSPTQLTVFKNMLFFVAYSEEYGQSVWKSDGTTEGTEMVYGVKFAYPYHLTTFKDKLYFTTDLGTIVRTDGTASGTEVFFQASFTYGRPVTMAKNEKYLYFSPDGRTFYRDDGTSRVEFLGPLSWEDVYFNSFYLVDNRLVVIKTSTYQSVVRIYSLSEDLLNDDVEDEWSLIKKLDAPPYGDQELDNFTNVNGKLYFSFRKSYDTEDADELWTSDGTESGTKMLKSFNWSRHYAESESDFFFAFNGKLFFRSGEEHNHSLWTCDGTSEGTVKVHDVILRPPYNDTRLPVVITNDQFYFSGANSGKAGLWTSDGTPEGTRLSIDMTDEAAPLSDLTASQNIVYFVTSQQFASRLWSNLAAPKISVRTQWGQGMPSGSKPNLFYAPSIGSCTSVDLFIDNKGQRQLYLRSIVVSGTDFYLKKQSLPESISPGESVMITVMFNGVRSATSRGVLTIFSNDLKTSKYILNLEATANSENPKVCKFSENDYVTSLNPQSAQGDMVLSNSVIEEGQPINSVVGALSYSDKTNVSYQFIEGEGAADNESFVIEGNVLKTKAIFDYDHRSLYTVRVKATANDGELESSFRISIKNQSFDLSSGSCEPTFERTNFSYKALELNESGHLFATTTNGKILRSVDGGTNWEVVYSGTYELSGITFQGNVGIVESSHFLVKSEDSGATWFQVYVPLTGDFYYQSLASHFLDDKIGYVGTVHGEVFYTSDGGHSWEVRAEHLWYEIRRVFFISENKGYAIAEFGELITTNDGGRTWSPLDLSGLGWNTRAQDIWFIDSQRGFFIGNYGVYKTSDAGATWHQITDIYETYLQKIKFNNSNVGFIYGAYYSGSIYKTSNGGSSWEVLYLSGLSGTVTGVAYSSDKIFASTAGYYSQYQSGRGIGVSSDNGSTWTLLDNFPEANIRKINFSSNGKGFVIVENGLYTTNNDGLNWKNASINLTDVGDIHFIDDNTLILLSDGNIYKSTNGGTTVRNVLTTSKGEPYVPAGKLYSFPGDILFSVSWYAVYRSDDLGETWDLISTDVGYYTQGMHFISSTIGYRIELFGSVEKTTDGGKTWSPVFTREPNESDAFNAIFFVNENLGFAGGAFLRKSQDGGKSWTKIKWPLTNIVAIHFDSESHGYVVSRSGRVDETADGGNTWTTVFYASSEIYSHQFLDNQIYLAGEAGITARLKTLPSTPGVAGYINGPDMICAGDVITFNLAVDYAYQTQWTTNGEIVEEQDDRIVIRFYDAGEYGVSAKYFNACASGEWRSKSIIVSTVGDAPIITGPNPSTSGKENVAYSVEESNDDYILIWEVDGDTGSPEPVTGAVLIDWASDEKNGNITVLAVNESGCRAFATLQVELEEQVVAIEKDLERNVRIYPNPSPTNTTISSSDSGQLSVRILDIQGRELARTELAAGGDKTIPTQHLPAGLYLLEISDGNRKVTKKFIKE